MVEILYVLIPTHVIILHVMHTLLFVKLFWYDTMTSVHSFPQHTRCAHAPTWLAGVYRNNVNADDTPGVEDFYGRLRDATNMDFRS